MKRFTVLFVALFALSLGAYAAEQKQTIKKYTQEEWDKKMKEQEKENWRANLKLEYPGEWLKGVIFITTEKDPMENFKENLKKEKKYNLETSNLNHFKEYHIQFSWNSILNTVEGDRISFLENHPNKDSRYTVGGDNFKKQWLVTRAFGNNGKTVCWSIPIKFKKGRTIEIELNEKNAISSEKLEKIYDSIIK